MSPLFVISIVVGYFCLLVLISYFTGKDTSNAAFFSGNKQSPWFVVAFGMIGASLSGVTFISVPGWVAADQFAYMQMVFGYLAGYLVIGTVLMPLYYRLNLTSIYGYLEQRFGFWSYKTGAFYFLLSRVIGASFRLYLVAIVLQLMVFDALEVDVPFGVTVFITVVLIWLYTFRSGIKTIIWTDTIQTLSMLIAVGLTVYIIASRLGLGFGELVETVSQSQYSQIFFLDNWSDENHFIKRFLGGAFITICMTGLDQDMMQKNLTCKSIGDAQKNMFWFSIILVGVNLCFLVLGALLYIFAAEQQIALPEKADYLYPTLAMGGYLGATVGILFILGLIAAAYSSADSALTALTTSFCVDFLDMERTDRHPKTRLYVHIGFSFLLMLVIMLFKAINDDSVIAELFKVAGYTYGPLLGLYAFGLFLKRKVRDRYVPWICIASPLLCVLLESNSMAWFNGYQFGFEILLVNGAITFAGLFAISQRKVTHSTSGA